MIRDTVQLFIRIRSCQLFEYERIHICNQYMACKSTWFSTFKDDSVPTTFHYSRVCDQFNPEKSQLYEASQMITLFPRYMLHFTEIFVL